VILLKRGKTQVLGKRTKFESDSLMAELCLGVAVVGVNTLIVMAIFVAFT
jgi:hypothetical protein